MACPANLECSRDSMICSYRAAITPIRRSNHHAHKTRNSQASDVNSGVIYAVISDLLIKIITGHLDSRSSQLTIPSPRSPIRVSGHCVRHLSHPPTSTQSHEPRLAELEPAVAPRMSAVPASQTAELLGHISIALRSHQALPRIEERALTKVVSHRRLVFSQVPQSGELNVKWGYLSIPDTNKDATMSRNLPCRSLQIRHNCLIPIITHLNRRQISLSHNQLNSSMRACRPLCSGISDVDLTPHSSTVDVFREVARSSTV
jgi:hypothetical protein